ncbi:MAG: hypothetical protein F2663_08510 [Actinobacteria bacterium]|uniref:Unannotated protein n=1 Tax=freshwater metagenome TaxID=449393 RepID=A0A6J6QCB3_9ZZZZ|nr:hypothetical protein [Actinomycetota bacterium]
MSAGLAQVGGAIGAIGVALMILRAGRTERVAGLVAWALGSGMLAIYLAPAGHHRAYAAAAVFGAVAAALLAWAYVRHPWLLAVSVLLCAPARIPVSVGHTTANLLLPLYLVVAAAALVLAWKAFEEQSVELIHGEPVLLPASPEGPPLGVLSTPLAAFIAWTGVAFLWTVDPRQGAIYLLFFVLPFGVLAVTLARLPWHLRWNVRLAKLIALMAALFGAIGLWEYATRNVFWNPKVIVDNAYAPSSWFYRVNSVFYDPSIYGRFLVVALTVTIAFTIFSRNRTSLVAASATGVIFAGLVPSFSQSSFVALAVVIVGLLIVVWGRRAVAPLAVIALVVALGSMVVPSVRHKVVGTHGLSHATGGRSKLVSNGLKVAFDRPVFGAGTGGFRRAYAEVTHLKGKEPKAAASHDTPITIAAEGGIPLLALFAWVLVTVFGLAYRNANPATGVGRAQLVYGLALLAMVTHSLFYDSLFEDPIFWSLLALVPVAVKERA